MLVFTLALASAACFRHSYTVGNGGDTSGEANYSAWHSHWIAGLIGEDDVDIKKICPSGNATIKDSHSFLNSIVGALIGIIYYPTTVEVYCDQQKAAVLQVSPESLRKLALNPATLEHLAKDSPAEARELASAIETYERRAAQIAQRTDRTTASTKAAARTVSGSGGRL